jgi:hypothetical protein
MPAIFVEFLDQDPHDFSEGLGALKADHHVTDGCGHFVFLFRGEDSFNELYIYKGHDLLLFVFPAGY